MLHQTSATSREHHAPVVILRRTLACILVLVGGWPNHMVAAQTPRAIAPSSALDSLVARAIEVSPRLRVVRARVDAARARVAPAGARPDPMVMVGVQNLPASSPDFRDEMTMKMIGVSQTFSLRGKLALARRAAEHEADAMWAELSAATLALERDVRVAYYEIVYADRALEVVIRSHRVLLDLARATELRYGAGLGDPSARSPVVPGRSATDGMATGAGSALSTHRDDAGRARTGAADPAPIAASGMSEMTSTATSRGTERSSGAAGGLGAMSTGGGAMPTSSAGTMRRAGGSMSTMSPMASGGGGGLQDVVQARLQATRLGEEASGLQEARRAALARLNSLLDRRSDSAIGPAALPDSVRRAAIADTHRTVRFVSATLGSRADGSPLPPLADLQDRAVRGNASIRAHEARLRAQHVQVRLADRARIPDVDVALEYGQRDRMPDMVSAVVSLAVPIQRRRVQGSYSAAARAELAAREAEHREEVNQLRSDVARLHADLERDRTQLALLMTAVIPQARVAVDAARSSFGAGRSDLVTVLSGQAALFNYETTYYKTLTSFATTLANLEQLIGGKVLP